LNGIPPMMWDTIRYMRDARPTANAGKDQSISLALTNTVQLKGSGTDIDGTVNAFAWTKISGPITPKLTPVTKITSPNTATTTVLILLQGPMSSV